MRGREEEDWEREYWRKGIEEGREDDWKRRTEEKGWKVEQMIGRGRRERRV